MDFENRQLPALPNGLFLAASGAAVLLAKGLLLTPVGGWVRKVQVPRRFAREVLKILRKDPTRIDCQRCPVRTRDLERLHRGLRSGRTGR